MDKPLPGTVKKQGVLRNDGTGKLDKTSSMPNLSAVRGTTSERFEEPQPAILMPACYSSHRAMSEVYRKNPHLFQGHGKPENRLSQNYWAGNFRHTAVEALAYQRRQYLLPEIEYLHRSKKSDGFLRSDISRDWNINKTMADGG